MSQLYYATAHPPARQATLLRFDLENDRDAFVSENPVERRLADPPADPGGFRFVLIGKNSPRPLAGYIRELREDENDRVVKSTLIHAATLGKQGQYDEADAAIRVAKELLKAPPLITTHMGMPVEVSENRRVSDYLATGRYPGPNENPSPAEVAARFAATLKPVPGIEQNRLTTLPNSVLTITRLLAFTDIPPAVLREHARETLRSHGLVTPGESSGQTP